MANRAEQVENTKSSCADNNSDLCLVNLLPRDAKNAQVQDSESDNGIEIPNRDGWRYNDIPDRNKIFGVVDKYDNLDYRQKSLLDKSIENALNGNLKDLSYDLRHDKDVWNAFADVLKNTVKADVKLAEDPVYKDMQMTIKMPGSNESLTFGWRGGLTPVSGTTSEGKTVAIESLNKSEVNEKALNQIFSNILRDFRQEYMRPSGMRSTR